MTIDEAIRHCLEVAERNDAEGLRIRLNGERPDELGRTMISCIRCRDEHRQLAEWLKDYKRLKTIETGKARCTTCKHYGTYEIECRKCYQYNLWEGIDEDR